MNTPSITPPPPTPNPKAFTMQQISHTKISPMYLPILLYHNPMSQSPSPTMNPSLLIYCFFNQPKGVLVQIFCFSHHQNIHDWYIYPHLIIEHHANQALVKWFWAAFQCSVNVNFESTTFHNSKKCLIYPSNQPVHISVTPSCP